MSIELTNTAKDRIYQITNNKEKCHNFLRLEITGGGCSGFQYKFTLDDKISKDDIQIKENSKIYFAIDQKSLEFVKNAKIDFINELGGAFFKVDNPDSTANCGCGASFDV
jgi:iron-sulfur cluster insertion protein